MVALTIVLSGGLDNTDPQASLGGPPSPSPLTVGINNLFSDLTESQLATGYVDYKCCYLFNDAADDDYDKLKIWIESETSGGSNCLLGLKTANENQTLTFVNVQDGTFTLRLDSHETNAITFDHNPVILAGNIQSGLRGLPNARNVVVTQIVGFSFLLAWTGLEGNKKYPLVVMRQNNLGRDNPLLPASVNFEETQPGSPINAIAPDIGNSTTPPTGIEFVETSSTFPLTVGLVKPSEGFSFWIRRTTDKGTTFLASDSIVFMARGDRVLGGMDA